MDKAKLIVFNLFGDKYFDIYQKNKWKDSDTSYFPRGFINVKL